eukprot:10485391-Heterocapsa_arctica.AAC.1
MEESHITQGRITREDRAGNQEADELATKGLKLHQVPKRLEEEVAQQDRLVEGLLQMMLGVMKNVQEKTPVRKKEEKQRQEEVQR